MNFIVAAIHEIRHFKLEKKNVRHFVLKIEKKLWKFIRLYLPIYWSYKILIKFIWKLYFCDLIIDMLHLCIFAEYWEKDNFVRGAIFNFFGKKRCTFESGKRLMKHFGAHCLLFLRNSYYCSNFKLLFRPRDTPTRLPEQKVWKKPASILA